MKYTHDLHIGIRFSDCIIKMSLSLVVMLNKINSAKWNFGELGYGRKYWDYIQMTMVNI